METYRSGHNEPHSKCGYPSGYVGSNPTVSANCEYNIRRHTVLYSVNDIIRYSEIAPDEKLSVFGLVNHFQDCSNCQSQSLGVGVDELIKAGRGWLLSYWQIDIKRLPKFGESVTTGTWAYSFERFLGHRNFIMKDASGEVLACADSLWVYVDTASGKPARAEGRLVDAYPIEPKYEGMDYETRKINTASHYDECGGFYVTKYQLDTNYHVNNAWYIQIAQEYLPDGFVPAMIRVDYKMPAVYGDKIYPYIGWTDEGRIQIDLRDGLNKTYALVEFAEA